MKGINKEALKNKLEELSKEAGAKPLEGAPLGMKDLASFIDKVILETIFENYKILKVKKTIEKYKNFENWKQLLKIYKINNNWRYSLKYNKSYQSSKIW